MSLHRIFSVLAILVLSTTACAGDDWPMWRSNAGHTAASDNQVPEQLSLAWSRTFGQRHQVWDDPLNHDMMTYDKVLEPIVKDGRMFIGFNDTDKLIAVDLKSGKLLWTFFTNGPVRFSPVAWKDKVFLTSDDGYLYCLNAADGSLEWKRLGGPSHQKALGNERIIGAWPARGGPVIADDTIYFAASIWPFMGTFIYSLDAETGALNWVNDATSADYIKQPHSAPSFAGVGPQGTLGVSDNDLIVPGGRSIPAVFDRTTGALRHFLINSGGKGSGGSFVAANDGSYYVHTRERGVREFDLKKGLKTAFMIHEPVLTDDLIFSAERKDEKPIIRAYAAKEVDKKTLKKIVWEIEVDGQGDLILSGETLFAAGDGFITPILLGDDKRATPKTGQPIAIKGEVLRLLTADERLIAVTLDGRIDVFAKTRARANVLIEQKKDVAINNDQSQIARSIVDQSGFTDGHMIWYEAVDAALLAAVAAESEFQIDVVNENPASVARLRTELDAAGLYGKRIRVHVGTSVNWMPPQFIANTVIIGRRTVDSMVKDLAPIQKAYDGLRPYGGRMLILHDKANSDALVNAVERAALENVEIAAIENDYVSGTIATRVGALTGSGDWTHQYGNIGNTVKSDDSRVKLPLGVLWFGGSSNMDVLPRHGHGPPEQVVNGRLYIQGMNSMNCRDVYTGRLLWKHEFEDLGTNGIYYDATYTDEPLDLGYNQVHIPGANGRGTNYVATADSIYVAVGSGCVVLDAVTGDVVRTIQLPPDENGDQPEWGFIGITDDVLLAGNGFANYLSRYKLSFEEAEKKLAKNARGYGAKSLDVSASRGLIAFDRHTGKQLWSVPAEHSFVHNAIVAGGGRVYCLDKQPEQIEKARARRGKKKPQATYRIVGLDLNTGKTVWQNKEKIFGSWLSYSAKHDVLLQAGAAAGDRLKSEADRGMAVYDAATGNLQWIDEKRKFTGPCILHNDSILTSTNSYKVSAGAFRLLDGQPILTTNPLTGKEQPWQVCRAYGCNSIIASENLLTFRSGAAGFYDLTTKSGTGNLGGFKSGCTANLVVANGVLNAPDYTRTCTCGYQNQTSLGLVHMPNLDLWTVNQESNTLKNGERISRIGVNFGAPGDRLDRDGTLWVDYPIVGGDSAEFNIKIDGDHSWYRTSSSKFSGDGPAWVGSSGLMNATRIWISLSAGVPENQLIYKILKDYGDAEEEDDKVNLTSDDLEMSKTDKPKRLVGLRFNRIKIPPDTKIRSAYIQFTAAAKSDSDSKLTIRAIERTDVGRFQAIDHGISKLKLSKDSVAWKPDNWLKAGDASKAQRTPDLSQFVREHIQRKGREPGDAVGFVISGTGERNAKSQKDKDAGPKLIINTDTGDDRSYSELPAAAHTVRLYFADPQPTESSQRKFAVSLQGETVIEELDIVASAGQTQHGLVKEFKNVEISDALEIRLTPIVGQPVISGVEIIRE